MKTCCACGYKLHPEKHDISFHKFPKDESLNKAWCSAVGFNFSSSKTAVLCSQHFVNTCFFYPPGGMHQRKHIKKGSVPTIFESQISNISQKLIKQTPLSIHDLNKVKNNEKDASVQTVTPPEQFESFHIRYVGDCNYTDLESPEKAKKMWNVAIRHIEMLQKKMKVIQQQNRRLKKRVTNLKSIKLLELNNKKLILKNAEKLLSLTPHGNVRGIDVKSKWK
ncbi:THAP domain-containing protein 2-like [Odontomachus brunneus]|uniref:THAP domain-containing protein 2-like n=1 Tax=Odontomachus brunneus TaxID=486640 RepID=UPI0013F259A0|nr:THAP domain-containing protein 2-like [Odontomachus brunneus]